MSFIIKMKKSLFLFTMLMVMNIAELITSEVSLNLLNSIMVQKIISETLEKERALFEKFMNLYCSVYMQQSIDQKLINEAFSNEEQSFFQANQATLFFHALHEDNVVGYISCDLLSDNKVCIRQLAFDPQMFDVTLIKELLFAIFTTAPKTKHVTVSCPVACFELTALFKELGFIQLTQSTQQTTDLYATYELNIYPKCKICDVLYADLWDNEEDTDSNWSDDVDGEEYKNYEALTLYPALEEE